MKTRASRFLDFLLLATACAVALIAAELGYRAYMYWTLPGRLLEIVDALNPAPKDSGKASDPLLLHVPDAHTGYRYRPNFVGQRGHPWYSHWRTNSHGHVSQFEYPTQKPAGEYRIAVVGDSMTANITNNVRWTELLEEHLNASAAWKERVGGKFTRVINFGVDGMGMVQFAAMVRYQVRPFQPDFVIVNFISDDILRRLRFLNLARPVNDRNSVIRAYVQDRLDHVVWFGACPELLAATLGPLVGKKCALPLDPRELLASTPDVKFASRKEAIAAGAAAVADIVSLYPNALFLEMPTYYDLDNNDLPEWRGLVEDVQRAVPSARFASIRAQLDALLEGKRLKDRPDLAGMTLQQITALPAARNLEVYRWFFLPDDLHYSDYGTAIYAREVAKFLIGARLPDA